MRQNDSFVVFIQFFNETLMCQNDSVLVFIQILDF